MAPEVCRFLATGRMMPQASTECQDVFGDFSGPKSVFFTHFGLLTFRISGLSWDGSGCSTGARLPLTGLRVALGVVPLPHEVERRRMECERRVRGVLRQPPGVVRSRLGVVPQPREVVRAALGVERPPHEVRRAAPGSLPRRQARARQPLSGLREAPEGSLTTELSYCRGPARGRRAPGLSCRAGGAECVFLSPAPCSYSDSNPWLLNFSVRLFSVTVLTM
jgi:hypothetical protein